MKLLLISLNQQEVPEFKKASTDISALSVRYLSSYLKSKGHEVKILFLAKPFNQLEKQPELEQIGDLVKQCKPDLVGISLMSNHFFRARQITQYLKNKSRTLQQVAGHSGKVRDKFNTPVIWGGIHPTIQPSDCLDYADLVCVGEGEQVLDKLLQHLKNKTQPVALDIPGIWYKKNNQLVNKGTAPLLEKIDNAPFPDYDLKDHYIIHQGQLMPLTLDVFKQYYPASINIHRVMASRGCPYACAYCCNSFYRAMYGGCYLRLRSVQNVIDELIEIKEKFPFITFFKIMDDSFAVNNLDWIQEFSQQYKEKIGLPFSCLLCPLTINKEKLAALVECGLNMVQIGLQSGSDRINKEIYFRHVTSEKFLSAIRLLEEYQGKLRINIDVIVDNPYEKEEDLLATANVLNQIKRPFNMGMFSLSFYPGTTLYKKALEEGLLKNPQEYLYKQFHLLKNNDLNKIIYLVPHLKAEKIVKLAKNRQRLPAKIYIRLLFFLHMQKNKLPYWVLALMSRIKKMIS